MSEIPTAEVPEAEARKVARFLDRRVERLGGQVESLLEQGRFDEAAGKQEEICRILDADRGGPSSGSGHVDEMCDHLGRLAEIHLFAGHRHDAHEARYRARELLEAHLRNQCPQLLGDDDAGGTAIEIRHRQLDYDLETARLLNRLAMLHHKTDSSRRARAMLQRAMAIARPRLGPSTRTA